MNITKVDLRYAGQYIDAETGLYFNYRRYYDPVSGRYTATDPIGLDGGLNRFLYVFGHPLLFTDRFGLQTGVASPGFFDFVDDLADAARNGAKSAGRLAGAGARGVVTGLAGAGSMCVGLVAGVLVTESVAAPECEFQAPGSCLTMANESEGGSGDADKDDSQGDRDGSQDKKLSKGEIDRLINGGVHPHDVKDNSRQDLFKDKNGDIYVKPKKGQGPGDPTGLNINDFPPGVKPK